MKSFVTHSSKETQQIAKQLAQEINSGVIALSGELGAGKTTFTQGFAQGLGINDKIISPTFVLIRQHQVPNSQKVLYHIDLYRLDDESQIKGLGIEELLETKEDLVLIEWAEKLGDLLLKNIIKINIEIIDENSRRISVN